MVRNDHDVARELRRQQGEGVGSHIDTGDDKS